MYKAYVLCNGLYVTHFDCITQAMAYLERIAVSRSIAAYRIKLA